jgi:hypothetical protein
MLQQAIAVSLFPEHEVRVATSAPDAGSVADVDAVIVDGAWTDERDAFVEGSVRAARKTNLPIIWIEGAASSRPPQYDRLVVIKTPIERSALKAALAESLALSGRP